MVVVTRQVNQSHILTAVTRQPVVVITVVFGEASTLRAVIVDLCFPHYAFVVSWRFSLISFSQSRILTVITRQPGVVVVVITDTVICCCYFQISIFIHNKGTRSIPALMGAVDISWSMGMIGYSSIECCFSGS
ncbi:hypothetical protein WN943_006554 [Citrus x changshan-huyou]